MNVLRHFGLLCLLTAVPLGAAVHAADAVPQPRTITVTGSASQEVAPTRASMSFGVIGEAATVQEAKASHDAIMNRLMTAMRNLGIPSQQLQTDTFSIVPIYTTVREHEPAKITSYRVTNKITLSTTDVNQLAAALDQAVAAGANVADSIYFSVDRPEQLENNLLAAAVRNGRHKADLIAQAAGARLGALRQAEIYDNGWGRTKSMALYATDQAGTPIAGGTQEVSVRINLVFDVI